MAAKSILSLDACIGCSTTSAYCGKGKMKPVKIFLKSRRYIIAFTNITMNASLGDNPLNVSQQFVCDLSGL